MSHFTLSRRSSSPLVDFPTAEISFSADGTLTDATTLAAIREELSAAGVTDLFVLCGGWSDSDKDLRALYGRFAASARQVVRHDESFAAHTYGMLHVLWPARRWPEAIPAPMPDTATPEERSYRKVAALEMQVTSLRGAFSGRQADRHLLKVWQLINSVSQSVAARVSLVEHVRELVRGTDELNPSRKADEYASRQFLTMHPIRLLEALSEETSGAVGPIGAPGPGPADESDAPQPEHPYDVYQGIRNLVSYAVASEMRARSEMIGRSGLRQCLSTLSRGLQQTRFHLVGHSFGARALLTAVDAPAEPAKLLCPKTITILQGALPENAFAPAGDNSQEGFFHSVLAEGKAGGPILITYSLSDETAGLPYVIAGKIAAHSQGGSHNYPYPPGPMAHNGAVATGAVQVPLSGRTAPRWARGMVANLNGDGVIGSHTDVCTPEVARAILSAATTTT